MKPVIAIDGHAGSGKGTMAQKLANYFGFAYLDTGMMYRTIAFLDIQPDKIFNLSIDEVIKNSKMIPHKILRSEEISKKASDIAKSSKIREAMTGLQRDFATFPGDNYLGSVLDGRDIGTVVIPDAICKIFITANLQVRAMRRLHLIKQSNIQVTFREIYESLEKRDQQDQSRDVAPLTFNDNYICIDTSNETVVESFVKLVKIVENKLASAGFNI